MWRQPKSVWAVAFACVVAFMGIGLVDPILKPIADNLHATPSQVSLLFTSLQPSQGYFKAGWVTGIIVFVIAFISLAMTEETFGKDLNYTE